MQSTLRVAAVLFVLAQAACQSVAPPTTEAYANADNGLAFDYPAGWVVSEVENDRNAGITLVPAANLQDTDAVDFAADQGRLTMVVGDTRVDNSAEEALSVVMAMLANGGIEYEFVEEPALKMLGGQEYAIMVIQFTGNAASDKQVVILYATRISGDQSLLAVGEASPEGIATFQPIVEAVLASLVMSRPTCADEPEGCP